MNRKMSRKEFLAQLAEDKKFREDAFQLIAGFVTNTKDNLSPLSLGDYCDSDCEDSDEEEVEEEADESSDDEPPPLCSECGKCGKRYLYDKKGTKTEIIVKCQQNGKNKTQNVSQNNIKHKPKENIVEIEDHFSDSDDNDEASDCDDCQQFNNGAKRAEELTEEEKKKRRNEKKKIQKKKKRDKRKAEKQSNIENNESNGQNKSVANTNKSIDNNNSLKNNKNNKKLENNSNKNKSNTNSNQQKNATKTETKQKDKTKNKTESKIKSKAMDNIKTDQLSNGWINSKGDGNASVKSSPKSDRESDNTVHSDGAEEEELLLNSAYVSQIAQRKNKPSVYQKSAQPQQQSEAQDIGGEESPSGVAKHKSNLFSNYLSNNFDVVIKNNSSLNSSNNQNKTTLSTNSREDEEFPKYKQFFFEKQKQSKGPTVSLTKEEKNQNLENSVQLAILANHRAQNNLFAEAIDLFTQAINFNPKDYRFYVNRSYCYDSIQDYRNALKDAEYAIKLKPDWPKCHYRKGKALAGLKNYAESEIALKKVLTLERDCIEAIQDLRQVRYSAIIDMGYDSSTAELYSANYDAIKDALNALSLKQEKQKSLNTFNSNKNVNNLKKSNNWWNSANNSQNGGTKTGQTWDDDDIYISDDEFNSVREPTFEETSPTNPFGWKALWVGNVSLNAKLDTVSTMFRKFGNLNYCNIFKGNNGGNFILVHYDNSEAPTLAMSKYQAKVIPGVSIADTPLTIRFRPNKDQKKPNYDQRLESDECYYWRTTGCARGDNCLFKHIQANKGVDKQAWMCNPTRKPQIQKPK